MKYKLKVGYHDMVGMKGPEDQADWDTFETFLRTLDPTYEYIPGEAEWYIYLLNCEEEDLTLMRLHFPLVHIHYEMYS
jgi:hypothetical protein